MFKICLNFNKVLFELYSNFDHKLYLRHDDVEHHVDQEIRTKGQITRAQVRAQGSTRAKA